MKKIGLGCLWSITIYFVTVFCFFSFGAIEVSAKGDTKISLWLSFIVGIILFLLMVRKLINQKPKVKKGSFKKSQNKEKEFTSTSFAKSFKETDFMEIKSTKFPSEYLYPKKDLEDNGSFFFNKKIVITGGFESFPFRETLAKKLWELGADIDTNIGVKTEIALVGSYNVGPKKMEKIISQNVRIIREEELIEKLG